MTASPWILVALLGAVVIVLAFMLWSPRALRSGRQAALPGEWSLTPRPVFSTDERRLYRQLREALPQHVVLAKLPLVRFCQPVDPKRVRYWFDLLGATQVAFAVCSANGRVLAVVDLDNGRGDASRTLKIKQAVLNALRIRYLRCPADQLPGAAELQMLVPQPATRTAQPGAHALHQARDTLASTVASRRAQRSALWQDSTQFPDSFFAPDTRPDGFGMSEQGGLYSRSGTGSRFDSSGYGSLGDADVAGVVVDSAPPRFAGSRD
jgi:Protein of unknown function (DUF2726)